MPDCVKVARQTLTLFVWVRILVGQPHRGVAQFGRALRSGRRGRRFKSCHLDHVEYPSKGCSAFYIYLNNTGSISSKKGAASPLLFCVYRNFVVEIFQAIFGERGKWYYIFNTE